MSTTTITTPSVEQSSTPTVESTTTSSSSVEVSKPSVEDSSSTSIEDSSTTVESTTTSSSSVEVSTPSVEDSSIPSVEDSSTPSVSLEYAPVFSSDNKTVQYGYYPQSYVSDANLVNTLNALEKSNVNNWTLYEGSYYVKEVAKVYNNESYTFDDGTAIVNGNEYWFKCEEIVWNVLSNDNGTYSLVSSKLLDTYSYYNSYSNRTIDNSIVYANNYKHSDIRTWLNNDFASKAFALDNSYLSLLTVNNEANTTASLTNKYACDNTSDYVTLLTYQDYLNASYGFDVNSGEQSKTRECKTTDYARAKGAWYNTNTNYLYNGTYWTRTPSDKYYYCAYNVNSSGYLSNYTVDGDSHCVRPSISIIVK